MSDEWWAPTAGLPTRRRPTRSVCASLSGSRLADGSSQAGFFLLQMIAAVAIEVEALRPVRCDGGRRIPPSLGRLSGSVGQALKAGKKRQFVLPITSYGGSLGYI